MELLRTRLNYPQVRSTTITKYKNYRLGHQQVVSYIDYSLLITYYLLLITYTETGFFDFGADFSGFVGWSISSCKEGFSVIKRAPLPRVI